MTNTRVQPETPLLQGAIHTVGTTLKRDISLTFVLRARFPYRKTTVPPNISQYAPIHGSLVNIQAAAVQRSACVHIMKLRTFIYPRSHGAAPYRSVHHQIMSPESAKKILRDPEAHVPTPVDDTYISCPLQYTMVPHSKYWLPDRLQVELGVKVFSLNMEPAL